MVDFVNINYDRSRRPEEMRAVEMVNSAAHELARIPHAWGIDTVGVDDVDKNRVISFLDKNIFSREAYAQKETYTQARARFDAALKGLSHTLQESGVNNHEIAQVLISIEARVHQQQTIQTDPAALELLSRTENQSALKLAGQHIFQKSGTIGYMALGFGLRSVGGLALGFAGAPLAASAVAYLRSRNRTAEELRERDRLARSGKIERKEGDLNFVDARSQIGKIKYLLDRIDQTPIGDRAELLASLKTRIDFVRKQQDQGLVRYGDYADSVKDQTDLSIFVSVAGTYWAESMRTAGPQHAVAEVRKSDRLKGQLSYSKSRIKDARKEFRNNDAKRSIKWAAGFSVAGALIADLVKGDGVFSRIRGGVNLLPKLDIDTGGTNTQQQEGISAPTSASASASGASAPRVEVAAPVASAASSAQEAASAPRDAASAPEPAARVTAKSPVAEAAPQTRVPSSEIMARSGSLGQHIVSSGDTLSKIASEQIPGYKDKLPEVYERLKLLTSAELGSIGLSSDINKIVPGQSIKLERLKELLESKDVSEAGVKVIDAEHPDFEGASREKSEYDFERERERQARAAGSTRSIDMSPVAEKQAAILEKYFLNKTLSPEYWGTIRTMSVTEFERMANLPQDPGYKLGEKAGRIKEILTLVQAEPLTFTPLQGEKMEAFVHRLFIEITRQSGDGARSPVIKKLLTLLDMKQK